MKFYVYDMIPVISTINASCFMVVVVNVIILLLLLQVSTITNHQKKQLSKGKKQLQV